MSYGKVTCLSTIVPLRESASEVSTEDTLGGLWLPFGPRVSKGDDEEFAAVDRLTVIAHDRFDEVVQQAKAPRSIVMKTVEISDGPDVSMAGVTLVEAPSIAEMTKNARVVGSRPTSVCVQVRGGGMHRRGHSGCP